MPDEELICRNVERFGYFLFFINFFSISVCEHYFSSFLLCLKPEVTGCEILLFLLQRKFVQKFEF